MTKEEQEKILRNRGSLIGSTQGPLTLGSTAIDFPANFSNIGPETTAKPIPLGGGGTASMGLGGAQVSYPSRLGLAGGDYGTRFQFGAQEFGPARLPQAQPINTQTLTQGLAQLPTQQTPSFATDTSRTFMNIQGAQTAQQKGLQEIKTPFGSVFATEQQSAAMMTPRTMAQQGSRTPEQQQALLAQMRERGAAIGQRLAGEEATRQQGLRQGYYAFRQGLEERRAQEMLTPLAYEGFQVGRARREAAGQALVGAERWKQVASGARGAMDTSPVSAFGGEFRQGSMGQFSPIQRPTYAIGGAAATAPQVATTQAGRGEQYQGNISMGVGGTPFSFTPFSSNLQTLNEPFQGLAFAVQPKRRDTRFTPLPFGLRKQTA